MKYPPADRMPLGTRYELSTHLIALEIMRRGYEPLWLRPALFVVEVNGRMFGWNMTRCTVTSSVGAELTSRKDYSRTLLRRAGLSVATGRSYCPDEYEQALAKAKRLWPVVVKPAGSSKGHGVSVAYDEASFAAAWQLASGGMNVVVEQRMPGEEARFLTVGGRCVAVAGRIPAHVIGDGVSTVAELVTEKNRNRAHNPHLARHQVPISGDPDRVPGPNERVVLDHRGGFSTGADSIDLTDSVHSSYLKVAARAEHAFPALGLSGVDIIAQDWTEPASADNHIIVEVNSRPAIGSHHFPWEGKPRDAAAAIVDFCFGNPVGAA